MNKKVAIMTWYTYRNYGTALQASAICNKVRELGYSADMIKYLPRVGRSSKTVGTLKKEIVCKAKCLLNKEYSSDERERLFSNYLNERITETKECHSYVELSDLNNEYDAFLCGSDQIWSPLNFNEKYFLPFVSNSSKKIAYAPSLGASKIDNPAIIKRMSELISEFDNLSVRELKGAELIEKMTNKKAQVVLDPTLLMTPEEWDDFANVDNCPTNRLGDYIICYFLGDYKKYMRYVRLLSKRIKMPYYVIPVKLKEKKSKESVPFEVGPSEFVSLIRNAKHICTDSFHGIAFATNYRIPFSVFKRFKDKDSQNQNSRIFSFLSLLSLDSRLVDAKERDLNAMVTCDFSKADESLTTLRESSLNYLKNSLEIAMQSDAANLQKYKITDMCCGCGACATVCSKGAITISLDPEGFQHYSIDADKCVKCGLCKNVCPMTGVIADDVKNSSGLYSAKSNSFEVLKASSSGGVAHELARHFVEFEAYACGCIYDSNHNIAKHIIIEPRATEKLHLLQGSKYIQSVTQDVMASIVNITRQSKLIFFGTPCQCAAVDKLCKKHRTRDNIYIVDLICHGVPSYYLWTKYLHDLNSQYGVGEKPEVCFRSNDGRWNMRTIVVKGNGISHSEIERKDDFYAFFRRGLCDMRSCSECPYRQKSSADLRIGDYWGPRFNNDKDGVSMIIAINERGKELVELLENNNLCYINEFPLEEYWKIQAPSNHSPSLAREQIIEELKENKKTISKLRKEYCRYYDLRERISVVFQGILRILKKY